MAKTAVKNATRVLTPEVQRVLRGLEWDGTVARIGDTLDRKLYTEVNKVLEAFGGQWVRKDRGHRFESEDAAVAVAEAAETGEYVDFKTAYQFFETPPGIAAQLLRIADLAASDRDSATPLVLEPSAGYGAIATAIRYAGGDVRCIEIDPAKCDKLRAAGFEVECVDFLTRAPEAAFDAVVMNPPFSGGQDMAHVRQAYQYLRPGGVLVAVMSPRFTYGSFKRDQDFRAWLAAIDRQAKLGGEPMSSTTPLPAGTFRASGTEVRTVILRIRRPVHCLSGDATR